MKFNITNNTDNKNYQIEKENETEARHWVINTLDLSKNWTIKTK